ncbi:MAG: hypothetical protein VX961_06560, partial [Verrucomicrobiota bacterium]|nr:hypothetical protein [Verrucomicrobiota bacterium]
MIENTPPNESIVVAVVLTCLASLMIWVMMGSINSGKFYIHFFTFYRKKHPLVFKVVITLQAFFLIVIIFFAV